MLIPTSARIGFGAESGSALGDSEETVSEVADLSRDESLQFAHWAIREARSLWSQGNFKAAAGSFHAALGFLEAVKPGLRDSCDGVVRMHWRQCAVQLASCYVLLGRQTSLLRHPSFSYIASGISCPGARFVASDDRAEPSSVPNYFCSQNKVF